MQGKQEKKIMQSSKRSIKRWLVVAIILVSGMLASQARLPSTSASLCTDVNWGSSVTNGTLGSVSTQVNWGSSICK